MLLHAFGILCGFALVAFAAASRPGRISLVIAATSGALLLVLFPAETLPDPVWAAVTVFAIAALLLWRTELDAVAAAGAGLAAGTWVLLLARQGLPVVPSLVITFSIAAASFILSSRNVRFAPRYLIEEALLICAALAIVVACSPAVLAGYRSALIFTAERVSAPPSATAPWALQLSAGLLVAGGLYALWKRR